MNELEPLRIDTFPTGCHQTCSGLNRFIQAAKGEGHEARIGSIDTPNFYNVPVSYRSSGNPGRYDSSSIGTQTRTEQGQPVRIVLTGSLKYHPIAPLQPQTAVPPDNLGRIKPSEGFLVGVPNHSR
ncbi:hypothetical protein BGZ63DRAFT_137378 [Mariannaea sp. PMI_226]|nr:hypothetical protein BGZ63DRAFT_137378 [Mariannaea sp. PMI_226]